MYNYKRFSCKSDKPQNAFLCEIQRNFFRFLKVMKRGYKIKSTRKIHGFFVHLYAKNSTRMIHVLLDSKVISLQNISHKFLTKQSIHRKEAF